MKGVYQEMSDKEFMKEMRILVKESPYLLPLWQSKLEKETDEKQIAQLKRLINAVS